MADVFLNGRFLPRDDARVSPFDAGLQHAVGLFETLQARVSGGEAFVRALDRHMTRLAESARVLGLSDSLRAEALGDAVVASVERAGFARARVRLTITGGDLNLLARARDGSGRLDAGSTDDTGRSPVPPRIDTGRSPEPPGSLDPTVLIDVQPATEYPAPMFEDGVGVSIADARANPFNPFEGHKTLNYWWRLRELQSAASKRVAEALVFTITNHLAGGCVSNAFLVKDGVLLTPIARGEEHEAAEEADTAPSGAGLGEPPPGATPVGVVLPSPVLPGVTRSEVLELAHERGLEVRRRMLSVSDVLAADELFLTNSSWGILPVVRVEAATIGRGATKGRVGEITCALRARWMEDWDAASL